MLALLALLLTAALPADCAPPPDSYRVSTCEVRTLTLDARESLTVRNPVSGSVTVQAWDRDEIGVRAEVRAYETNGRSPEALLAATEILASGGTLRPQTEGGGWVETRLVVFVPRRMDLDVSTNSGAVTVTGVTGALRLYSNHGAVRLADVGGDVSARSNSGDVTVELGGEAWEGAGAGDGRLDAFANFGTLRLLVPERYNAVIEAAVRWGSINDPDASPREETRRVYVGAGGATLSVSANAGSIQIERG